MATTLETLSGPPSTRDLAALAEVLRDAVEGGASVGFMLPLNPAEIDAFWHGVFLDVEAGQRVVLVARERGAIIGTVQLGLATRANSRHRAEVQKLLVLRSARGRGVGLALMQAIEKAARELHRSLLVLDTSATGNAIGLYERCGYTRSGIIPRYARDPDGPMIDTVIYYKELPPS